MTAMRLMLFALVALACTALAAVPTLAADPPREIPQAPEFVLPPSSADAVIVVANSVPHRAELKRRGYRVYPDIAQAVARANDGDSIFITAGVYQEYIYIVDRHNLSLIGEEGVTVIASTDNDVCFIQESTDIYIHNIDMIHEIGESPCLHNCIVVWDCQDVLIEYCDLSGSGYIGVEVLGNGRPDSIMVENCAIHDCEEAYYDVSDGALLLHNNVIWDNTVNTVNPTGWREGEMFGSERQPHDYFDFSEWEVAKDVPQPPAIPLPSADTAGLRVVVSDDMYEDQLRQQGYDTYFTVQSALDAVEDGDTVYITSNIYFESLELNYRSDVTIIGEELTLVVADTFSDVFFVNECENIRVYNVDLVHEEGEDCSQNCFVVNASTDVTLEYCDISGCGFIGIWAWGFDTPCDVTARNCYVHDCEAAWSADGEAKVRFFGTVIRDNVQETW